MTSPILQFDEIGDRIVPLGAALRDAGTERLQRSLNALADLKGNAALRVVVDGAMGPKTAGAVNLAIKTYAPNSGLPLPLSVMQVKTQQTQLANVIDSYINSQKLSAKPQTSIASNPDSIRRLQSAIKSLWPLANDRSLDITVDGIAGPKTQAAVNTAFQKYITGHKLPLPLSIDTIKSSALTLAQSVENRVKQMKVPGQQAVNAQIATDAAKAKSPQIAAAIDKASILALQKSIVALAKLVKNAALNIAVDGVLGPKTTAATNLALSKYVRGVTAALKSGKLSQAEVNSGAVAITKLIENEIKALLATPAKTPEKAVVQAKAVTTQQTVNAIKTAKPTQAPIIDKTVAKNLQTAVNALAKVVGNKSINLVVDGIVGPKTATAINTVISKYLPNAPKGLKRTLSVVEVQTAGAAIASLINDEITRLQALKNQAVSAGKAAKDKLDESTIKDIETTVDASFAGDSKAQQGLANLETATHSSDPEIALKAQDALDVASAHAVDIGTATDVETLPSEKEILSYLDERRIHMDPTLIEDPAELGAMLGLLDSYNSSIDPVDLGADLALYGETGFSFSKAFKKVGKGITKGVKGAAKGVSKGAQYGTKGIATGVQYSAQKALQAATTLLGVYKIIFTQIALPLARTLCRVPQPIIIMGARSAGVSPDRVVLFCKAVQVKNMNDIKRLLPDIIKVSVKLSVMGAVPGLGPVLRTIQLIPSPIRKVIPGLSYLGGWNDSIVTSNVGNCDCY